MICWQPFRLLVLQKGHSHGDSTMRGCRIRSALAAAAFVEKKGRQYVAFALQAGFGDRFGIVSRSQRCASSCTGAQTVLRVNGRT